MDSRVVIDCGSKCGQGREKQWGKIGKVVMQQ